MQCSKLLCISYINKTRNPNTCIIHIVKTLKLLKPITNQDIQYMSNNIITSNDIESLYLVDINNATVNNIKINNPAK